MAQNSKGVAFIEALGKGGRALLAQRADVTMLPFANNISAEDYRAFLAANPNVHAVILGAQVFGPDEVAAAPKLDVVARVGVGFDMIDIPALAPRRIPLMTAGIANSPSVAEQAFHMLFQLIKRSNDQDRLVREGRWLDRLTAMPGDIFGKTMLVIGCGRIGSRVVKRAVAMEMDVHVFDPFLAPDAIEALGGVPVTRLDDALPGADVVTIHCPRTPDSMGMFDARRLALMKPSAFLINTARGGLVDEAALFTALKSKRLAGAGLDVLLREPPPKDHPLFGLPNVVFAAHMAGVTTEAVERMGIAAVKNVLSVFDRQIIEANVVNREVLDHTGR
jgi:D-3-phosphoglycerate dehydrogenase / 2-oxoglutarate reductase